MYSTTLRHLPYARSSCTLTQLTGKQISGPRNLDLKNTLGRSGHKAWIARHFRNWTIVPYPHIFRETVLLWAWQPLWTLEIHRNNDFQVFKTLASLAIVHKMSTTVNTHMMSWNRLLHDLYNLKNQKFPKKGWKWHPQNIGRRLILARDLEHLKQVSYPLLNY